MVDNFYTLAALVREWQPDLVGGTVGDAFSQQPNELTLAFARPEGTRSTAHPEREWMLRCSVQRPMIFIFRTPGYSKARRNVATLFQSAFDQQVTDLRIATRDRMIYLDLADSRRFQMQLFGARANVFLVSADGAIEAAFRNSGELTGTEAPSPRAAPMPETFEAFSGRWKTNRNKTRQAVSSAFPLFGRTLATETIHRAGVTAETPEDCTEADRRKLFEAGKALIDALQGPTPCIYQRGRFPDAFSLVPLQHRTDAPHETFDTVDEAVRVFVRRRLAARHFQRLYEPLEEALSDASTHYRQSAERMLEELSNPSRADRYERWGHLLMAQSDAVSKGADEVTLPDLFEEGDPVTIPLDPSKSVVENAQHYYRRAQRTRRSREEAEARLMDTESQAEEAAELLAELESITTLDALKRFRKDNEAQLARYVGQGDEDVDRFPFRRFDLGDGFEAWVGRNAQQNQELTFHVAQKYDLWLHARGVPGSHVILHKPNRDAEPGRRRRYTTASIAAHFSKARGSGVVPVMITERKYVTSPKGAAPGQVRVEREDVLMVEPGLPDGKG
jgi:predicted ribosome quality control (RQC) complex YloA/Tae2 family protein